MSFILKLKVGLIDMQDIPLAGIDESGWCLEILWLIGMTADILWELHRMMDAT